MMACAVNVLIIAKDTNPETVQLEWPALQDFLEDLADRLIGDIPAGK